MMSLTNKIIILSFLVFVAAQFLPQQFVTNNLFYSLSSMLAGNVYVVVTALFMHGSLMHWLTNSMLLYIFGNELEAVKGSRKFAAVFFTGGIAAFILSSPFYAQNALLVGNSGAVFTVMSAVAIVNPLLYKKSRPYKLIFGSSQSVEANVSEQVFDKKNFLLALFALFLVQFTIFSLYTVLIPSQGVSNVGHLFGFLIGAIFGIMWSDNLRILVKDSGKIIIASAFILFVFAYSFYVVFHIVSPNSSNFIDNTLSALNIHLFLSEAARCNNYCIGNNYDFGTTSNHVCTCGFNTTISEIVK